MSFCYVAEKFDTYCIVSMYVTGISRGIPAVLVQETPLSLIKSNSPIYHHSGLLDSAVKWLDQYQTPI